MCAPPSFLVPIVKDCLLSTMAAALLIVTAFTGSATAGDNFKICVAADKEDFRTPRIVIPPGLIFESWGRLIGDLTDPTPDFAWREGDQRNDHYGVVITRQVVLTAAKRCATTTAQVVLSQAWGLQHPVVTQGANLFFQALAIESYGGDPMKLPNHLGEYIVMGILNGTAIADIRDAETIP